MYHKIAIFRTGSDYDNVDNLVSRETEWTEVSDEEYKLLKEAERHGCLREKGSQYSRLVIIEEIVDKDLTIKSLIAEVTPLLEAKKKTDAKRKDRERKAKENREANLKARKLKQLEKLKRELDV